MPFIEVLVYYRRLMSAHRRAIILFAITIAYIAYLLLGGFTFLVLEGPEENAEKNAFMRAKDSTLEKYPTMSGEALDHFLQELSANGVKGITVSNATAKWTIGNSVLYAVTLLTTIGYGHLSTSSVLGKLICMVYTMFGIPLTLFVLSCYVDRLHGISEHFMGSLFHRFQGRLKPMYIRVIHLVITMLFIMVACFLVPAYVFSSLETNWSYFDAIYFCFISLTTVGLGDFVPGLNMKHPLVDLYRFGAIVYILVGVTIMMYMLALMTNFCKHYNTPYAQMLPLTISPQKLAIYSADQQPTYGAIVVHVAKTTENGETKSLLP